MTIPAAEAPNPWPRLDALLLAALVVSRLRIDTLAEVASLPLRQNDVARHPWLGNLLSASAMELLAQQQMVDPIGLLLIVAALGCLLLYLLAGELRLGERTGYRLRLVLIWAIVGLTVFAPAVKLMLLRQNSGPASYSHDGGVIQTEATIDYLLSGRNPYSEDYVETPMAEWGISEFRTALYHYPYLPWTFIFSAPFRLMAESAFGWYDQRMVYLLLFGLTLALLPGLAGGRSAALLLSMVIGLNPIMGSDLIFGQNDSFVLAWIVLSLWLWKRGQRVGAGKAWSWAAAAAFGLACASKPTAWFLAPFLLLLAGEDTDRRFSLSRGLARSWPAAAVAIALITPYLLWDASAMFDDVWRWSSGTATTAYQIWGWGASNLVLALGWVQSRFDYWPFWLPELLIGIPLMAGLLWRQTQDNSIGRALWGYGLFAFAFFYVSRFLNENYLGFIIAVLALGTFAHSPRLNCATPPLHGGGNR